MVTDGPVMGMVLSRADGGSRHLFKNLLNEAFLGDAVENGFGDQHDAVGKYGRSKIVDVVWHYIVAAVSGGPDTGTACQRKSTSH